MAKWTDEEIAQLQELCEAGHPMQFIADELGRTFGSVKNKMQNLHLATNGITPKQRQQQLQQAASISPIEIDKDAKIRELEATIARLTEQKKWETHSESVNTTGGTLTLRRSDDHHCDDNHLLSCGQSLTQKSLVVIQQYQPSQIQLIMGDDWIAGRGIFKEQDAQMAVAAIEQQIQVGAVKARRFLCAIREVSAAPITIHWLRGNHEYANKIQVHNALFFETRALCEDVADLSLRMWADLALVNLAHAGDYYAMAQHGYGHSQVSPNSPRFIADTKDKIIQIQNTPGSPRIRRILSGHTHWMSVGLERLVGVEFDTTGGLQRNNRVQLGMNARPAGWIAYIGPPDTESDILQPIGLKPDDETYRRELADPHLAASNKADAAECLTEYRDLMKAKGIIGHGDEYGLITEGRW